MSLGADIFQRRFLDAARAIGVEPDEDQEAAQLSMDAQESLFRYTVASWVELVPFLVGGYEEVLRDLPAGEMFGGEPVAAPSSAAAVSAPSPSSSLALSAAAPPPTTPASSQLSVPSQSWESSTGSASRGAAPAAVGSSERELRRLPSRGCPPTSARAAPQYFCGLTEAGWKKLVAAGPVAVKERPKDWTSVRLLFLASFSVSDFPAFLVRALLADEEALRPRSS